MFNYLCAYAHQFVCNQHSKNDFTYNLYTTVVARLRCFCFCFCHRLYRLPSATFIVIAPACSECVQKMRNFAYVRRNKAIVEKVPSRKILIWILDLRLKANSNFSPYNQMLLVSVQTALSCRHHKISHYLYLCCGLLFIWRAIQICIQTLDLISIMDDFRLSLLTLFMPPFISRPLSHSSALLVSILCLALWRPWFLVLFFLLSLPLSLPPPSLSRTLPTPPCPSLAASAFIVFSLSRSSPSPLSLPPSCRLTSPRSLSIWAVWSIG